MNINWDSGIFVYGVEEPTYGNFGGAFHSVTGATPVDRLDQLFVVHDASDGGIAADRALLNNMVGLNDGDLGGEGNFYKGIAELAMLGELTREGYHFSPYELYRDMSDAVHAIEIGFSGMDPAEQASAATWATESAWHLVV